MSFWHKWRLLRGSSAKILNTFPASSHRSSYPACRNLTVFTVLTVGLLGDLCLYFQSSGTNKLAEAATLDAPGFNLGGDMDPPDVGLLTITLTYLLHGAESFLRS